MSVQVAKHWFTVGEYERMGVAGILSIDDQVELIEGEIIEMSPIGNFLRLDILLKLFSLR